MIGVVVGVLLLSWVFGRTRGLLGGLAGGFLGALVLTGMISTAGDGELATIYSPGRLASTAVPLAVVAAVLALLAPHATGFASLGWAVGALVSTIAVTRTGQAVYVLPLAVHLLAAAVVVCLARRRARYLWRRPAASRSAR